MQVKLPYGASTAMYEQSCAKQLLATVGVQLHRYTIVAEDHLTCPCISCSAGFGLADVVSVLELKPPYELLVSSMQGAVAAEHALAEAPDLTAASASGMQTPQVHLVTVLDLPVAC